ncbi:UDP-glucose--hexose-1-phosphate uridylyltransferase [Bacillus taeanensis]|uniref:Galactose-1-phosphate uridylyltransferase n=1 Tax=Bacillus taeanensis TaxID=273032 RepID=A0A366Y0F3_9BACI|nr:UDP-glucose--hexose-1-phosphate uridylyltransferase [Bacillus taeanensis]RBW71326.1 UDP-glucose--hexose-1-phosphate uridylyltransferase [Bacillus taeanensis]
MASVYTEIERLLQYGLKNNLIGKWDVDYTRNAILEVLRLDDYEKVEIKDESLDSPVEPLEHILEWAFENGRLEDNTVTYRDLLDTKIMSCFVSKPSEIIRNFYETYENPGPEQATKDFYEFSKNTHYIRQDRIAKNEHWVAPTEYGDLEITINLSKPEKDPKEIAAAKTAKQSSYPKCLLCKENVGYAGRVNHPARQNHRIIPVELTNRQWFLQYSPYVYYNEHCIVFLGEHEPMKISKQTFERLLEFVEKFPHYFLGSNADLPIVGGSILSHDHFQGGSHDFPMAKAEIEKEFIVNAFPHVTGGIVKWPMSVIRLQSEDRAELVEAANFIYETWKGYSDERVNVLAYSGDEPHNTVTPISRKRDGKFEFDLVLRNNRTNDEHPLGIFHPHHEVHHIKKENIGLIEVMGLAVLPGRLKEELKKLSELLVKENAAEEIEKHEEIVKHLEWAKEIKGKYADLNGSNAEQIVKEEVGLKFSQVLEHAGVFKRNESGIAAFEKFTDTLNQQ